MNEQRKKPLSINRQPLHVAQLKDALLNVKTVQDITGLSRSTIHAKVKAGTFPAPIRLSIRCVRWSAQAVTNWISSLAVAQ